MYRLIQGLLIFTIVLGVIQFIVAAAFGYYASATPGYNDVSANICATAVFVGLICFILGFVGLGMQSSLMEKPPRK